MTDANLEIDPATGLFLFYTVEEFAALTGQSIATIRTKISDANCGNRRWPASALPRHVRYHGKTVFPLAFVRAHSSELLALAANTGSENKRKPGRPRKQTA